MTTPTRRRRDRQERLDQHLDEAWQALLAVQHDLHVDRPADAKRIAAAMEMIASLRPGLEPNTDLEPPAGPRP
ncbi:hypothetical protein [Antarcticirhabdus aurantiaca]|uniref:hypothetical protein n=1 Tax=Antarcticirhabdus aurantiaca TaxID=2606717 RepID=UPI00131A9624|nr:hypothetical protein [Antarcticirhabdus aurantiaca]